MTTVEDVEMSLDIMTNTIKRANARELQGILLALIDRRLDFLDQIRSTRYAATPAQVATLRSWDTYDHLIEWRMRCLR